MTEERGSSMLNGNIGDIEERIKTFQRIKIKELTQSTGAMESAVPENLAIHGQGRIYVTMTITKDSFLKPISMSLPYVLHKGDDESQTGKTG